jgi:hypothetical protein
MPTVIDQPTPTEELRLPQLPSGDGVHVPQGEPGLRSAVQKLRELEEAIRLHEEATGHPAAQRRPGDLELYRRLRGDDPEPRSDLPG